MRPARPLASETWAASRALPIAAYLTHAQTAANNFVAGEGLPLAPTIAVARMLERAHLALQDFDFYEIHEAFAAQVLVTLKAFEDAAYCKTFLGREAPLGAIDRSKLNVKGSEPGVRPSLCGHRGTHYRQSRQTPVRARRPGPDFGVHRGRHGRGCHHGKHSGGDHEGRRLRLRPRGRRPKLGPATPPRATSARSAGRGREVRARPVAC